VEAGGRAAHDGSDGARGAPRIWPSEGQEAMGRAYRGEESASCAGRRDLGLALIRAAAGGVLVAHGSQKLFGWFGGKGIEGTAAGMEAMGFEPGRENAIAAGLAEAGGGALLTMGLAAPAAGAAAAGAMATAVAVHWDSGLFTQHGGFELPAMLGAAAVGIGLTGAGRLSLDHATDHALDRPWMVAVAFIGTALAAGSVISRRTAVVARRAGAAEQTQRESEAAKNVADEAGLEAGSE
jgi:putative oxidoreductase